MGKIRDDILNVFLQKHPEQLDMLKAFLNGFDITHSEKKDINNTTLYLYILKPEDFIKEAFGVDREILLAYSPYEELQPRALQAMNMLYDIFPYRNRIDTLNCFIVSQDKTIFEYKGVTSFGEGCSRILVPFIHNDLISHGNDAWYIRNILRDNFFDVDLFGYTLPLRDETAFFGRQEVVSRYIDAIKRCENRGIFGVRKTGKTSLLFKLDRVIREQNLGFVFFYDVKSPSYRKLHWNRLLGEICDNIAKRLHITIRRQYDEINIIKSFRYVMKEASMRNKKIVIMFDEIEFISFNSPLDHHWHDEFIEFWQTIWSVQSIHRNLVFILSGVNPSITEVDVINGVQNPLFGIVQSEYLQGLSSEDTHNMIRTLGKRMGLKFNYESIEFLYNQYNGHPMLTRLACSYINRLYEKQNRPVKIEMKNLQILQDDIDTELSYYFRHVVSEIHQFYPDEYEMFELLASGQTSDFVELSALSEFSKHLYNYGLVDRDVNRLPFVKMPVAGRYVAMELAKKENRTSLYKIIDKEKRNDWVLQRIKSIIRDLRQLEIVICSIGSIPKLFGENSFPEAEKFATLTAINEKVCFEHFVNVCNRCFVESIENYGKSIGKSSYFWDDIKKHFPALFTTFERMKIYRHSEDHLHLNPKVAKKYQEFWNKDIKGITELNDQYFCVQQKLLDGFLTNIQIELLSIT